MSPCMCSGDELIISNILHLYRYLVWLEVFLTNIDRSHPGAKELLQKGGIAVARSLIPGSLCAVDGGDIHEICKVRW